MTEAKHINKSLSSLGDVMAALASKQVHVPYRNSMLTQLLADSLSGQAKVMMFVHVAPEASSMSESQSTLQFATRVSDITLGQVRFLSMGGDATNDNWQISPSFEGNTSIGVNHLKPLQCIHSC